jgi:hypothetical protein
MAVTFNVPAEYVEDARNALVAELINDGQHLESLSSAVDDAHREVRREDRAGALRSLKADLGLLDQLPADLDARDTELVGEFETLWHMIEAMSRLFVDQLIDLCKYSPLDTGDVAGLADRLRWSAEQADLLDEQAVAERDNRETEVTA